MFGASPSVREQEKGLTSWPTHPKARAHSGDQPLRPEAVVPRTVRRATDPVLLWPLRPEAVVPRTVRRATDPVLLWPLRPEAVVPRTVRRATDPVLLWPLRPEAVVPRTDRRATDPLLTVDDASLLLRPSATRSQRCASSRVRAVLTSVCRSVGHRAVLTSVCRSSWLRPCFGELKARRLARLGSTNSTVTASVACPFELVTRLVNSATNSARPASSRRRSAVRTASTSGADGGLANPSYADTNNRCPSASRRGSALRAATRSGGRLSSFSSGSVPQRLRWSQDRPVGQSNRDRRAGHAVDAAGPRRRGIEDDPQFELTVTGLTDQEQALRRGE